GTVGCDVLIALALALALREVQHSVTRPMKLRRGCASFASVCPELIRRNTWGKMVAQPPAAPAASHSSDLTFPARRHSSKPFSHAPARLRAKAQSPTRTASAMPPPKPAITA